MLFNFLRSHDGEGDAQSLLHGHFSGKCFEVGAFLEQPGVVRHSRLLIDTTRIQHVKIMPGVTSHAAFAGEVGTGPLRSPLERVIVD